MNGGRFRNESSGSSHSALLFSKRPVQHIDVFISLLQVIMMKPTSFLKDLHHTYKRIKGGYSVRTDLCKVDYLVVNIGEGGGK